MAIVYPPIASPSVSASGGMTPTYIGPTETFTIPTNRQALKAMTIVIAAGGSLVIQGNAFLIEVT